MAARRPYGAASLIPRTDKAGHETWHGKWRVDGRQVMRKLGLKKGPKDPLGMTAREAEAALRKKIAEVGAADVGALKPTKKRTSRTITEVLDAYLADHDDLKQHTTAHDYTRTCANWFKPFFGDREVETFTDEDVRDLRDLMKVKRLRKHGSDDGEGLAPKSIRNHLTLLSTLLSYAVKRKWAAANVAADVPRPGDRAEESGRLQFLEVHEVTDLVAHAQPGDYQQIDAAMYLTAAQTGLRLGELRALRWHGVDVVQSVVRTENGWTRGEESSTKSRRRRSVPLSPDVGVALAELRDASAWDRDDDLVFAHPHTGEPLPYTPLTERYHAARDAAGVTPVTFHELRHTFGTTLARKGWPPGDIQALMGHSDLATTQKYMHYAPRHDQAARIAAAFAAADPRTDAIGSAATNATRDDGANATLASSKNT
jgi:integrase